MPEKKIDSLQVDGGVSRRDLLRTAAVGAGAIVAIPVLSRIAAADDPAPTPPPKPAEIWKAAGLAADFKKNVPVRVDLGISVVWVTRLDEKKLETVSARCTHRGCELGYDDKSTNLICPCHGGTFKLDGSSVAGTRREPSKLLPHLTSLTTRVNGDQVEVNIAPLS